MSAVPSTVAAVHLVMSVPSDLYDNSRPSLSLRSLDDAVNTNNMPVVDKNANLSLSSACLPADAAATELSR
eukprot:4910791-Amphidinium_carterae.1